MIKFSKVAFIVMIILIMVGGTGCMFKPSPYNKIERYLKEKYDNDTFTDVRPYGGQFINSGPVYQIECTSKLHPEFSIIGTYDEKSDSFLDNYMSVVYAKQFAEYVEKTILDELFGKGNYYYFSFWESGRVRGSENYYKDMTFQEFCQYQIYNNIDFRSEYHYTDIILSRIEIFGKR